jgi:hypothetical protein
MTPLPEGSNATPYTSAVPAANAQPLSPLNVVDPEPVMVEMLPSGSTRRTRLLEESAIKRLPAPSSAIWNGATPSVDAAPPSPVYAQAPDPAYVLIRPLGDTTRTLQCVESEM